jgi:hypothetical protein
LAREFFPVDAESAFRLRPTGVFCDGDGAKAAGVALLERAADGCGEKRWRVRPIDDLNRELTAEYGLPLDIGGKVAGLTVVAKALDCGEIAKAQIAMLLMRFPDPPPLEKGAQSSDALNRLANALAESGLLKDDDFESEHPRTGTPPNPGWFASKPKPPTATRAPTPDVRRAWPAAVIKEKIRKWVVEATEKLVASGENRLIEAVPVTDAITAFVEGLGLGELNTGEQRILDQLYANFDLPKTLEQLQTPPIDNDLGYERHHIVEQNPDNLAKEGLALMSSVKKFGRDVIDNPPNIVWIPRLKHESITNLYNSRIVGDPAGRILRQSVNEMDFNDQRAFGLDALRKSDVLR